MRTIIAGSRDIKDVDRHVFLAMASCGWTPTLVLSGGARGVDQAGELWAEYHGLPLEQHLPNWSRGKGAALTRNEVMATKADALVAVWDGNSRGTADMIRRAKAHGLRVYVHVAGAP